MRLRLRICYAALLGVRDRVLVEGGLLHGGGDALWKFSLVLLDVHSVL